MVFVSLAEGKRAAASPTRYSILCVSRLQQCPQLPSRSFPTKEESLLIFFTAARHYGVRENLTPRESYFKASLKFSCLFYHSYLLSVLQNENIYSIAGLSLFPSP